MITKDCWKGECNKFYYTSLRLIMELHHNTYTCIDLLCKTWAGTPSLQLISTALSMLLTSSSSSAMISPNFFYNKAIEKIKYRDIYINILGEKMFKPNILIFNRFYFLLSVQIKQTFEERIFLICHYVLVFNTADWKQPIFTLKEMWKILLNPFVKVKNYMYQTTSLINFREI